jgi:hypothetical protein
VGFVPAFLLWPCPAVASPVPRRAATGASSRRRRGARHPRRRTIRCRPQAALPGGLTAEDFDRIAAAIAAGRAESTRKTYASAWRRFERWCADRSVTALPADPGTVCAYLVDFAGQCVVFATIEGACAAIADAHHCAGRPNPVAEETVRRVRRGIRRRLGTAPRRQARPLDSAEIRRILAGIDRTSAKGIRDAVQADR